MVKLMSLPHSSACVERIFSQVNLMKTKTRNSLNTETLIGMLHAKRTFEDTTSDKFKVTTDHMKLMTERIYESDSDHQDE